MGMGKGKNTICRFKNSKVEFTDVFFDCLKNNRRKMSNIHIIAILLVKYSLETVPKEY